MSRPKKSYGVSDETTKTENNLTKTQEITKMSTPETKIETKEYTKAYKYFDLADRKMKSHDITVKFTPAADTKEAAERLGNDPKILLGALNDALQRQEEQAARQQVAGMGVPKKVVMEFIKTWRNGKPFSDLVTTEKGDANWKSQYDAQTDAILEEVTKHEFLVNSIKANAASFNGDSSDED